MVAAVSAVPLFVLSNEFGVPAFLVFFGVGIIGTINYMTYFCAECGCRIMTYGRMTSRMLPPVGCPKCNCDLKSQ